MINQRKVEGMRKLSEAYREAKANGTLQTITVKPEEQNDKNKRTPETDQG
jgi:hypothetical protein